MTVLIESGYTLPSGDYPLTHSRIAHSENWLSGGTAAASSTATDYDADAPLNSLTYELWQPTSLGATWAYDHGSAVECDYAVIAAHTLGSNGCTIKVQYSTNNSSWSDLTAATAIADDSPIFAIFEPVTARYWRINITTGSDEPTIGVIKFGAALQMPRPIYGGHAPISMARQTILRSNYSETGEFLGRTKQRTYGSTGFSWQNLPADWVHTNWPEMQRAIETEPFFVAWRPSDYDDVAFGQVDQVPVPSNQGVRDLMSVELSIRTRGYD